MSRVVWPSCQLPTDSPSEDRGRRVILGCFRHLRLLSEQQACAEFGMRSSTVPSLATSDIVALFSKNKRAVHMPLRSCQHQSNWPTRFCFRLVCFLLEQRMQADMWFILGCQDQGSESLLLPVRNARPARQQESDKREMPIQRGTRLSSEGKLRSSRPPHFIQHADGFKVCTRGLKVLGSTHSTRQHTLSHVSPVHWVMYRARSSFMADC